MADIKVIGYNSGKIQKPDGTGTPDTISIDDNVKLQIGTGSDLKLYHDGTDSFILNTTGTLNIATGTSGVPVTIGHSTSEVTIADNLTVAGNLTVTGTTVTETVEVVSTSSGVLFEGGANDGHEATLLSSVADSDKTYTLPNITGHIPLLAGAISSASVTAAEFALLDGGSTIGTTAIADGHGLFMNQDGTMHHTTVQTLAAYLDDEITAMPNLVTVGALNAGSITSGFTSIDIGSGTFNAGASTVDSLDASNGGITQAGAIAGATTIDGSGDLTMGTITMTGFAVDADGDTALKSLTVDDGSTIGPDSVSNLITLAADGDITIKDGTYDFVIASHDGTNGLKLGTTLVTATAAELNVLATGTSSSSIILADNDSFIVDDANGNVQKIPASDLATYLGSGAGATANNALNSPVSGNLATDSGGLTAGDVVAINGSGEIIGASAATGGDPEVVGVATGNVSGSADIGTNVHSAWGKVVNVTTASESITIGSTIYLSRTVGLATGTLPSTAGDTIYRLGYAAEATSSATDIDIIWMPQFIVEL